MLGRGALAATLLAAALLACDSPRPQSCAGDRVGTFHLRGDVVVVPDAGCPFASPPVDFTATLAFGSETSARLCVERPDAEPLLGTHDGDHVSLSSDAGAANVPSCACAVTVTESVVGDVLRDDGGAAIGFAGELTDRMDPTDAGASCERDAGPGALPQCGVPCAVRWQLTKSP